jgi:hypothetical protein
VILFPKVFATPWSCRIGPKCRFTAEIYARR